MRNSTIHIHINMHKYEQFHEVHVWLRLLGGIVETDRKHVRINDSRWGMKITE